ncbi:MAG: DUF2264 domain-containing protein, partial [Actinobacteria bacterium ATB1]|nr:DUF2264 domain-containing protein [Actinobacteria bacterium ATB1]
SNPLAGNPLATRHDVQRSVRDLYAPLVPAFSEGCARVSLGSSAAWFSDAAAELEGFERPLWGSSPSWRTEGSSRTGTSTSEGSPTVPTRDIPSTGVR